jgi:hypothetical protein
MRKGIFFLLFLALSTTAAAEWVKLGEDSQGTTIYFDPASIRRAGSEVTMMHLYDYRIAQLFKNESLFFSTKVQGEHDCKEGRVRAISLTVYSDHMAGGDALQTSPEPGNWVPAAPNSVHGALWKIACGKP